MNAHITVAGPDAAEHLRSLQRWLADEDELRGRTRLVNAVPQPGTLGPVTDSLAIALGPGGVGTALAAGLIAWLRQRTSDVVIRARGRSGETVELSARRVRGLDSAQLHDLVQHVADGLGEPGAEDTGP
jgi:Effector Associated Constant Component 1